MKGRAAVRAGGRRPAREIATREPDGSEWSISRPALAPPPPSGTAAWPSGPSGALHTGGAVLLCVAGRVGSKPALAPPPPSGTAAWPSSPSGALHTSGAGLVRWLVVWLGPAACCRRHGGSRVLSFWGGLVRVVTNVVNPRAFSLIMMVFWLGLTTFVTGVLVRRFESCWFDDVCNVGCPLVARTGLAAAHGHRSQILSARLPACLKPPSPLRACTCVGLKPPSPLLAHAEAHLKPPSPLRVRNGRFWCSFRLHWCCWFQWSLFRGVQW